MGRKTIAIPVEGDRDYVKMVKRAAAAKDLTIASVVRTAIDAHLFFVSPDSQKSQLTEKSTEKPEK